jgi:hypothetical protein
MTIFNENYIFVAAKVPSLETETVKLLVVQYDGLNDDSLIQETDLPVRVNVSERKVFCIP